MRLVDDPAAAVPAVLLTERRLHEPSKPPETRLFADVALYNPVHPVRLASTL